MASQLFQGKAIADAYASFRPVYPKALVSEIIKFCNADTPASKLELAVDVGCGSGQSTLLLKEHFNSILGVDVSAAQVEKAPKDIENVRFECSSAYDIPAEDDSVDLVTVAQTLHWLDASKFYADVKRILKSNGVLAVYGYGNVSLDIDEAATLIFHEVITKQRIVKHIRSSSVACFVWHNLIYAYMRYIHILYIM